MNQPPVDAIRVPYAQMRAFVSTAAQTVGLPQDKANLLADMLAGNDLKGVFSHGSQQIASYARQMRDGELNSHPNIEVVTESPCSAVIDGDGGLGYFPSHKAVQMAMHKALGVGIAVTVTRNHGHIGAAGMYARMTTTYDVMSFVTSGHQLRLKLDDPIYRAAGGSPMAFSAPCLNEDPLVLDFGTMHDLYEHDPHRDEIAALAPGLVLRSIGLGEVCQVWGGLLSGLQIDATEPRWPFKGANQGGLFVVFRVDLFREPSEIKREMDIYASRVRELVPFSGLDGSYLTGGVEMARQRDYTKRGIPVGADHRHRLEALAEELQITIPWPSR